MAMAMEFDASNLKAIFDAVDPCGDMTLDHKSLLQMLIEIDPNQGLWTDGNINLILDSAAPGCKGRVGYQQLLTWVCPSTQSDICTKSSIVLNFMISSGEEIVGVIVEPHWTGSAVKAKVCQLMKPGQEVCELLCMGKSFADNETIAELGVLSGTTLLAMLREMPEMRLPSKTKPTKPPDEAAVIDSEPSDAPPLKANRSKLRRPSLCERRKLALGSVETPGAPDPGSPKLKPAPEGVIPEDSGISTPLDPSSCSKRELFMRQLEESAASSAPVEPMTDTRHKVKAWGHSAGADKPENLSLWARRKAEISQISTQQSSITVDAMKLAKLPDVPESPKRPSKALARSISLFDPIPEDNIVDTASPTVTTNRRRNRPKADRNRFMSSS